MQKSLKKIYYYSTNLLFTESYYLKNEGVQSNSVDFRHRIRCESIVVRL